MATDSCADDNGGKLVFATVLVVVGVLGLFLLHVLGTLRRRSSNIYIHTVVMGTYSLSYLLVSYTLGLMQQSQYYVDEFAVWALSLLMLLGGTDNLMACNLNDVENWKSFHLKHILKAGLVIYIVAVYGDAEGGYRVPLSAILVINLLQLYVRIKSMRMASKSYLLSQTVKPMADYMEHLKLASGERPNPRSMKGYRYVVAGEHKLEKYLKQVKLLEDQPSPRARELGDLKMKFTTVEQIYDCKGRLLGSEEDLQLKDLCLSLALAKMLNRRFAGVKLAEADLDETKDFVFQGLLGEKLHERAFKVIEVELGFVYDLYYTRYPYLYHKARHLALCLPLVMVILCSWLTYKLFKKNKQQTEVNIPLSTTLCSMAVVTFLEAFQLWLHMNSGWFKVAFIRRYVSTPGMQRSWWLPERIIGLFFRLEVLRPWADRLGQYSLLKSCNNIRGPINFFHYVTLSLVNKTKRGYKKGKLAKLSKQMKQAVVDSLIESDGHLTNGVRSLRNNGVHEQLSWACDGKKVTHTILVWHIATAICKIQLDAAMAKKGWGLSKLVSCLSGYICGGTNNLVPPQEFAEEYRKLSEEDRATITRASEVASSLSQYCAYLVAFAPDLLPDHSFDSTSILDGSIKDVSELLGAASLKRAGCKTLEAKCEKLMKMSDIRGGLVVQQGVRLARQLTNEIEGVPQRWRVLSDFWAEMMLYVAPGEDAQARAHLEALARGGEFITHLWALLTHAGVLERDRLPVAAV